MPDPSPSETLRAAAARIRYCAPFAIIGGRRVSVAPIAAWLDEEACDIETVVPSYIPGAALAFAHSILEQP